MRERWEGKRGGCIGIGGEGVGGGIVEGERGAGWGQGQAMGGERGWLGELMGGHGAKGRQDGGKGEKAGRGVRGEFGSCWNWKCGVGSLGPF